MTEPTDDTIQALLRKQFDGPVPDAGFSDRVMQRLPLRRRRIAWPLWAGIVVGIVTCWLGLFRAPVLYAGWSAWMHGEWSIPAITMLVAVAGMSLLAAWWSVAETSSD